MTDIRPENFKYVATTPRAMTVAIQSFCSELSHEQPVFLEVQPDMSSGVGMCYFNAARVADRFGGLVVYGWLIWELNGVYLTAEHHAVAEVDGKLIDCTPPHAGERRVLFVPDRSFNGDTSSPPNIPCQYAPLVSHPLIERYCDLARRRADLLVEGIAARLPLNRILSGMKYTQHDGEMTKLLDQYLAEQERNSQHQQQKIARQKKKDQRQRKKHGRR
jgi:hypothetical protein